MFKQFNFKKNDYMKKKKDTSDYIIPLETFRIKQRESKLGN